LDPQACYLSQLAEEVKELFYPLAHEKNLEWDVMIQADLPKCVWVDDIRLKQVINNLVGNAIKFTESGQVSLQIARGEQDKTGDQFLEFVVEDSGVGLSQQQQQNLFQAFSQADSSITRKFGGTGLGLAISQRLVRLMGGRDIDIESDLDEGARFSFQIPMIPCVPNALSHSAVENQSHASLSLPAQLHGRVLLAEDIKINQEVALEQLRQIGLETVLATNGEEAVALFESQAFDLVLMDIYMPVLNGFEATEQIRRLDSKIPILAMSAAVMPEDKLKAKQAGMNGFITKPIDQKALLAALLPYLHYLKSSTDLKVKK
jgi:CheY-like chemotaxis protein